MSKPPRAIALLREAYARAGSPAPGDLATRAGISRASLYNYLHGDMPEEKLRALDRTLNQLGYTLDLKRLP